MNAKITKQGHFGGCWSSDLHVRHAGHSIIRGNEASWRTHLHRSPGQREGSSRRAKQLISDLPVATPRLCLICISDH